MKRLKTLASALVLLGLTVSVPHADAARKPHLIKLVTPVAITPNLAKENQKTNSNLENGFALIQSNDYAGAVKAFSKVLETEPKNQYAYVGRGLANFELEKYQQAKADLDQGISLDTSISYAYFFRGLTHHALGSKPEAISDLQIAANLFKKDGETEMVRKTLDAIEKIRKA